MLLRLQKGIVYGPVLSRRLGVSLGINLLPVTKKTCTFDCTYCQYGWTDQQVLRGEKPTTFPEVSIVREAVREALTRLREPPAYITFSGNGEPTLHPDFPRLVDEINTLRGQHAPLARTAILSNSTTAYRPGVQGALTRLDHRIMKLDAGTETTFRRFNRPAPGLVLDQIVEGLAALPRVTIQALFAGGPEGNADPGEIEAWLALLSRISPLLVQIYTLDRDVPGSGIEDLPPSVLEAIAAQVRQLGFPAEVF